MPCLVLLRFEAKFHQRELVTGNELLKPLMVGEFLRKPYVARGAGVVVASNVLFNCSQSLLGDSDVVCRFRVQAKVRRFSSDSAKG